MESVQLAYHEFAANYLFDEDGLVPFFAADRQVKKGGGSRSGEFTDDGERWRVTLYYQDSGIVHPGMTLPTGTPWELEEMREFRLSVRRHPEEDPVGQQSFNVHVAPRWQGMQVERSDGTRSELDIPPDIEEAANVRVAGSNIAFGRYLTLLQRAASEVGINWRYFEDPHPYSNVQDAEATDKASRKSLEAALIASYRRAERESPTGAFSRILPGYEMSSYRGGDERGGPLPEGGSEPYAEPGIPPLRWEATDQPTHSVWMGLDWSTAQPLAEVSSDIPARDGVYRIWREDEPTPLEYIGESANLRSRLRTHSRNRDDDLLFSYAAPEKIDAKQKRLEAETDLLGAHWITVREPPRDQH